MGGGTPALSFPDAKGWENPTAVYSSWIVEKVAPLIASATSENSPYYNEGANIPDPDDLMGNSGSEQTQYRLNQTIGDITAIDQEDYYEAFIDKAVEEAYKSGVFPSITSDVENIHSSERASITEAVNAAITAAKAAIADTPIEDMIDAYEDKIKDEYLRGIGRLASSMADINAVNSSAFVFGIAILNKELLRSVNEYAKALELETFRSYISLYVSTFSQTFLGHLSGYVDRNKAKDSLILSGAKDMSYILFNKINAENIATRLQGEFNRVRHVALREKHRDGVAYDARDAFYDFEVYQRGFNMLAAAGAAALQPTPLTPAQSVLGGAVTGAEVGAGIGFLAGNAPGALIGGGIGAAVGALAAAYA